MKLLIKLADQFELKISNSEQEKIKLLFIRVSNLEQKLYQLKSKLRDSY